MPWGQEPRRVKGVGQHGAQQLNPRLAIDAGLYVDTIGKRVLAKVQASAPMSHMYGPHAA